MRPARWSTLLIGAAATLTLTTGWGTANAAAIPPVAPTTVIAAGSQGSSTNTWEKAEEVPGSGALNRAGDAVINSVSCASPGNCAAGGFYSDAQAFVVNETNGTWGKAEEVPGTAALNQGGDASVSQLSCASPGDCSAGGSYLDGSGTYQAFVVNETNGTWGTARQVPGFPALGRESVGYVLSCASAGNCSEGGSYTDSSNRFQAFVVNETNGVWGTAQEVPGTGPLNQGGDAHLGAMSCASVGNCSGGGFYTDAAGNTQVFVVNETNGIWGAAEEVPGSAAVSKGGAFGAQLFSVSCASAGDCAAVGTYTDAAGHHVGFVDNETNGVWTTIQAVRGVADQGFGQTLSVSCASAGNCTAGGNYSAPGIPTGAFVVNEVNGTWGASQAVPGIAALNVGGNATTDSVSCASAGNCAAVGTYKGGAGSTEAFVVNQTNGTWGTAEEVPGTATLNKGENATINSVSCAAPGRCSAGGSYSDGSFQIQAFVVNES